MAEYTMAEAALLQYRLALAHRVSLVQLNAMTAIELYNLFDALSNESDKDFARTVRNTFPVIMNERGIEAALLAAAFYDQSRQLYGMTKGATKAVGQTYIAQPKAFLSTPSSMEIIENRIQEVGFHFHEVADLGKPIEQVRTPIVQIAQRAPLDIATSQIQFDMFEDEAAKNTEPKRVANGQGCNFCKHMAVFVGVEEWAGKFHKGCSCTPQPAWAYEIDYRPEWADAHEQAYYDQREEIEKKNSVLTRKTRQVKKTRVNSKGKTVTETKTETYYVNPDGTESKPESTSIRHILATMPRK